MSEYIVNVSDEESELFIARFGIGGTTLFGHQLIGEIVRCRDCKYLNRLGNVVEAYECDLTYMNVMPNDFCSWGERKEDA